MSEEVELVQTKPGRTVEYRGKRGRKRRVVIDREWDVVMGGEIIGRVDYVMVTHETRTRGRVYVNLRWESPGWRYRSSLDPWPSFHAFGKADAVKHVVRDYEMRNR